MANGINYDDIIIVGISGYNQTRDKPTFRILLDAWMHRPSQELTATNASSVVSPLYRFMRVSVDDRPRSALIPRRIPHRRTLDQWDFESSSQTDYGIIPDIRFDWIGRDGEGMHIGDVIHYYADILSTLMREGACAPLQEWEDLDEIELDVQLKASMRPILSACDDSDITTACRVLSTTPRSTRGCPFARAQMPTAWHVSYGEPQRS